jgi:hypothetical protein
VTTRDSERVIEARARYFADNGFSDATYTARWVKLSIGPVPVAFPNTRSRQRAIPLHDLHHVATGYPTTLVGEAEIGAWELAGGCGNYAAAWVLNAIAFSWGLALSPRRVFRAFVRGRHSRTLYRTGWRDDRLVRSVGELRRELRLDAAAATPSPLDRLAFAGWVALVAVPPVLAALIAWRALT